MTAPAVTKPATVERRSIAPAVAAGALVAVAVALLTGRLTGATSPWLIVDPGVFVRWGLLTSRILVDLAAALTVGLLVLAACVLPPAADDPDRATAHRPAMAAASAAATVWAAAELLLLVLSFADISGLKLSDPAFGGELLSFTLSQDLFRGMGVAVLVAATIGLVAAGASSLRAAGLLALLSFVGLIPAALAGHVAGSSDHMTAVTALALHLVGISVWVGGLAGLALMMRGLDDRATGVSAHRYSTLAGWAFAAVALSGVISAWLRLDGDLGHLASGYGAVIVLKVVALAALGVAGWFHRDRMLAGIGAGRSWAFARLVAGEVLLMGVAMGLGAALARTAPPVGDGAAEPITPAESLTGYPLPPEPTAGRYFTEWQPDLLWLLVAFVGGGLYLAAVRRIRARGDSWPVHRTVLFVIGLLLLLYVTGGGPAVYGKVLFSAHMIMHMALTMIVPPFLVLGAPVTLAMRALKPRGDGSRGPREWLVAVLASPVFRVLTFAPVVGVLFAGSLIGFYWSELFGLSLSTHVGHELMITHFLLTGFLFASVLIGVDPLPHRPAYPLRLLLLFATMAFHAFFGVVLYGGEQVLEGDFFGALGRPWGGSLLEDQQFGGGLAWATGELPTIALALILVWQWSRSDAREARRRDRAADRDGDAELNAYNEMLARLAERDRARP